MKTMHKIAVATILLGLLGGCSDKDADERENPDAQVALPDGNPDRSVLVADAGPDQSFTFPDGLVDQSVVDANPDRSVAPLDGGPDQSAAPVACQDNPTEGAACEPLPEGLYCRAGSCTGGCTNECRCRDGKWRCSVLCVDNSSVVPIDCGKAPLCRENCLAATVLPDGGLAFPTDGDYSSRYKYGVSFRPTDMSTLLGETEIGLAVAMGPPLEQAWLQDLASRVSIRTWPEMEEVPATISVADGTSWAGVITVKPNSTLADRWYVVRLSTPPFWVAPPSTFVAPDGSYVARFRVGSEPHIASVTFAGGANKHRLYIYPSEPLSAQQSLATIVQVQNAGAGVACSDVDFVAGKATDTLSFDCPSLTVFPDQITIGAGLSSTTSVALAPVTIAKASLTLASCGTDCQTGAVR